MKSIVTKYNGPTDTKGSRITASDSDGNRVSISYDHGAKNPHAEAALALCRKMGWKGTLQGGGMKNGEVFVFIDKESQYKI